MPITRPVPVPTPFRPKEQGGNPYLNQREQVVGEHIPQSAVPVGLDNGIVGWSNNVRTPIKYTIGLPVTLPGIQGPPPAPNKPSGFNEQAYRDRGWTDINAMMADYKATGGPGGGGGGSAPAQTTYRNPYSGKTNTVQGGMPSRSDLFREAYPNSDWGSFTSQYGNPDDFYNEINNQYNEKMKYLQGLEGDIRAGQPGIMEGIEKDLTASKSKAGSAKTKELGVITGSETKATHRKEDALSAARRLYDELRRGGRQRFGGASSAGDAMNTLLGVEQQRQMGQTRRSFADTMQELSNQKLNVENQYQDQLLQLDADHQKAVNEANQEFRARLDQINQNRVMASDAKSQARLAVLQDLRDKAFQINAQHEQFKQQLSLMREQQQLQLDTYAKQLAMYGQRGQQSTSNFFNTASVNPTSRITATGQQGYTPLGINSARGMITGNNDDYAKFLQGAVSNKDLPLWMQ